jgi:glucosamine--fructose-6-phosphate aminotransferase (isomerizing)
MMAILVGRKKNILTEELYHHYINELIAIPDKIETILKHNEEIRRLSELYKNVNNFLYLGRGYLFPVALEGALKLKEISYIHAEGYPAAEMKHGPIALIDQNMPVVVLATKDNSYDKIVSNIQEVKARKGNIIAIVNEGDTTIKQLANHILEIPASDAVFSPLLAVIPLQLLSYYIAVLRGCNVDQPRNLAKSVTVE